MIHSVLYIKTFGLMQSKAAPSKEIRSPASGLQVQTPSPDGEAEGKVEEEAPEAAQALEGVAVRVVAIALVLEAQAIVLVHRLAQLRPVL